MVADFIIIKNATRGLHEKMLHANSQCITVIH